MTLAGPIGHGLNRIRSPQFPDPLLAFIFSKKEWCFFVSFRAYVGSGIHSP
jgi:hypothetical protein